MQKSKLCVFGLVVALLACEVSYAASFGGDAKKKKKEEPKQQVSREANKKEVRSLDLREAPSEPSAQGGGGGGSILTKDYKLNIDRNPNLEIIRNPNAGVARNPNLDIPKTPVVTGAQNPNAVIQASIPKNPNANAVPRNPNVRE